MKSIMLLEQTATHFGATSCAFDQLLDNCLSVKNIHSPEQDIRECVLLTKPYNYH